MALTRVQTGVFGASGSGNSAVQFNSTIIESATPFIQITHYLQDETGTLLVQLRY